MSRGAPYGHFDNKERLLTQLAIDAWNSLSDVVEHLRADADVSPDQRLERALLALIGVARTHPHVYSLMFSTPADNPQAAASAKRLEDHFMAIVADVVGDEDTVRWGALLMSGAHGIGGLELSGQLPKAAWNVTGEQLVRMLIDAIRVAVSGR